MTANKTSFYFKCTDYKCYYFLSFLIQIQNQLFNNNRQGMFLYKCSIGFFFSQLWYQLLLCVTKYLGQMCLLLISLFLLCFSKIVIEIMFHQHCFAFMPKVLLIYKNELSIRMCIVIYRRACSVFKKNL